MSKQSGSIVSSFILIAVLALLLGWCSAAIDGDPKMLCPAVGQSLRQSSELLLLYQEQGNEQAARQEQRKIDLDKSTIAKSCGR